MPGRFVSRHLARCEACSRYGDQLRAVSVALSRQADGAPEPAPVPGRGRRGRSLLLAGGGAAILAAGVFMVAVSPPSQPASQAIARDDAPGPVAEMTTSVAQQLGEIARNRLLEPELAALEDDGRRGLQAIFAISGLE